MVNEKLIAEDSAEKFNNINIPDSLDDVINNAIQRGEEYKRIKKKSNLRRIYTSIAAMLILGVGIYSFNQFAGFYNPKKATELSLNYKAKDSKTAKLTDEANHSEIVNSNDIPSNKTLKKQLKNEIANAADKLKKNKAIALAKTKNTDNNQAIKNSIDSKQTSKKVITSDNNRKETAKNETNQTNKSVSNKPDEKVALAAKPAETSATIAPDTSTKKQIPVIMSANQKENDDKLTQIDKLKASSDAVILCSVGESKAPDTFRLNIEKSIKGDLKDSVTIKSQLSFENSCKYIVFLIKSEDGYSVNGDTEGLITISDNEIKSENETVNDEIIKLFTNKTDGTNNLDKLIKYITR